ncbi:efflux RND transporter permease subunit [Neptunomonas marina]|uniref:Efflux RND transporter permease subunit n=1 Tax=Neptunomonas marina TaxID=1815562 RepID=A0A437Q9E9_9GAMM|nr:efflux RND transporter permease subunit [Neptunomonas marina]RVU31110.1 efflux RND transporter permease subunit [Neptunomonas marina]
MQSLGVSGRIARQFMGWQLTPLLAIVGLLMGLFAAMITPREEEPQIDVTMANVVVPFPGASAADVESMVATPLEQILSEISGVKHIYSVSQPGTAVITVQFDVGIAREPALVRLYNAVYSNQDWKAGQLKLGPVIIKPKGIDDVPVLSLTLHSRADTLGAYELKKLAHTLETELQTVAGTRDIETIGGPDEVVKVTLDTQKLAARSLSIGAITQALQMSNVVNQAGSIVANNRSTHVLAGSFLSSTDQLEALVVGLHAGKPIYITDIAAVELAPELSDDYVWYRDKKVDVRPAVTLTVSKKPGENAVDVVEGVLKRIEQLKGVLIPTDVDITITRDYGKTANDKANTLIKKLVFATISVIALVLFSLGRREAFIVGSAVVLTLLVTLFASWAWGFTLNRVSLFALIFSIGILVDDAIVVVENIHRHLSRGGCTLLEAIPRAVDEVGGPTILATFTVIAALLPMAFVTGLMGPYMGPIPINASMGMLLSLIIAFTFTPWLSAKLLKKEHAHLEPEDEAKPSIWAYRLMTPFLGYGAKRRNRYLLGLALVVSIGAAIYLVVAQAVVMKMLPFDNKSEFQVVVDMPEDAPLEATNSVLLELSDYLLTIPEVINVQGYAGAASPIGFNGLVRQYYLRSAPNLGDLQVNLVAKEERGRSSHDIARAVRAELHRIAARSQAAIKIVEVPPGPPVMAPLVAEVYGSNYHEQQRRALELTEKLTTVAGVVDVDNTVEVSPARLLVDVDRAKASRLGVAQSDIVTAISTALRGMDIAYLHNGVAKYPLPIRVQLPEFDRDSSEAFMALKLPSASGALVPLSELVTLNRVPWEQSIYHKNLLPVVYVTADVAGDLDSPLYSMFAMVSELSDVEQWFIQQPDTHFLPSVKWDGEWQITYETFRDMGAAYSVGLILIYLLVVAQFGSYRVPLVIMAPIPLTMIGILPGHALLGAQFTATSMIGMIALAGIIVRNSILLVDFINQQLDAGVALDDAVVSAASVRAKPIILTALAAMVGALFILDDPIFSGLAVSLVFGLLVSTLLTLIVIPVLYYSLLRRKLGVVT